MKTKLTLLLLLTGIVSVQAQTPTQYHLRYDTVYLDKSTGNGHTELILKNATKGKTGAFLKNIDNGKTVFDSVKVADVQGLQDSLYEKIDKVAGKQLSTEDYTTAEKTKLSGIATGATANQTDAYLLNRANHTGTQAISTVSGLQTALDGKVNDTEKGTANGVATLNSSGKIPNAQIPALALVDTYVSASEAAMLALSSAEQGDVCIRTDLSKSYILTNNDPGTLASWKELLSPVIPAETDPIWNSEKSDYATSAWVSSQLGNYLPLHGTADNSDLWRNYGNNFSSGVQTGGLASINGFHTNGFIYSFNASAVKTFLGIPSGGETLQSVTDRGASTTNSLNINTVPNGGGYILNNQFGVSRWILRILNSETGSNEGSDFVIAARKDDGSGLVDPFVIKRSNGNVGIGTPSPAYKLDVNGSGNFTGTVNVADATSSEHAVNLGQLTDSLTSVRDYADSVSSSGSADILPIKSISSDYVANYPDYTILCTVANDTTTVTLPTAVGHDGKIFVIKNNSIHTVTVVGYNTQEIDGNAFKSLTSYKSIMIQAESSTSSWHIIAGF